jgi:hypothetical protein
MSASGIESVTLTPVVTTTPIAPTGTSSIATTLPVPAEIPVVDIKVNPNYTLIYNELNSMLGDGSLTIKNCFSICIGLMKIAESFSAVPGNQKKALVTAALEQYISEHDGDSSILLYIAEFIDAAIQLDVGAVHIKKAVSCLSSSLTSCLTSCTAKLNCCKKQN